MASSPLRLLVLPPLLTAMPSMSSTDIIVLSSFALYKKWDAIQGFLASNINPAIAIGTFKTTACLFTLLQLVRYVRSLQQQSTPADEFPVKPLFFPCQTSHVRMFPKKHGFSYSYLWVGIPIGWGGSVGGMISENTESELAPWWKRWFFLAKEEAWYTVNGDHYLDRGHVQGGLQGKLKKYLESQVSCFKSVLYHILRFNSGLITHNTPMHTSSQQPDFSVTHPTLFPFGIFTLQPKNSEPLSSKLTTRLTRDECTFLNQAIAVK